MNFYSLQKKGVIVEDKISKRNKSTKRAAASLTKFFTEEFFTDITWPKDSLASLSEVY